MPGQIVLDGFKAIVPNSVYQRQGTSGRQIELFVLHRYDLPTRDAIVTYLQETAGKIDPASKPEEGLEGMLAKLDPKVLEGLKTDDEQIVGQIREAIKPHKHKRIIPMCYGPVKPELIVPGMNAPDDYGMLVWDRNPRADNKWGLNLELENDALPAARHPAYSDYLRLVDKKVRESMRHCFSAMRKAFANPKYIELLPDDSRKWLHQAAAKIAEGLVKADLVVDETKVLIQEGPPRVKIFNGQVLN